MDIALMSYTYTLSIDEVGNYIDKLPILTHGLLCLCGTRSDKRYETTAKMVNDFKPK